MHHLKIRSTSFQLRDFFFNFSVIWKTARSCFHCSYRRERTLVQYVKAILFPCLERATHLAASEGEVSCVCLCVMCLSVYNTRSREQAQWRLSQWWRSVSYTETSDFLHTIQNNVTVSLRIAYIHTKCMS